jgi:catechol 2,3-dioxygenase-like lactoylglutathione lyase family enzyme
MVEHAVPILPSRDLRESLDFFRRLGFVNLGAEPEEWDYLILGRGSLMLHFIAVPDVDPRSTASSCYLYVDDADSVHEEWSAAGVGAEGDVDGSRLVPPVDTPYGMRELAVVDPSGNLVRVGSPSRSGLAH